MKDGRRNSSGAWRWRVCISRDKGLGFVQLDYSQPFLRVFLCVRVNEIDFSKAFIVYFFSLSPNVAWDFVAEIERGFVTLGEGSLTSLPEQAK